MENAWERAKRESSNIVRTVNERYPNRGRYEKIDYESIMNNKEELNMNNNTEAPLGLREVPTYEFDVDKFHKGTEVITENMQGTVAIGEVTHAYPDRIVVHYKDEAGGGTVASISADNVSKGRFRFITINPPAVRANGVTLSEEEMNIVIRGLQDLQSVLRDYGIYENIKDIDAVIPKLITMRDGEANE